MGNKAIIRVAKHSTIGGLAASGQHNFRERETQNADAKRTPMNEIHGAGQTADLLNRVSNLLPSLQKKTLKDGTEVVSKRRKDAVICIEYLITASPAHFGEWRESGNHGQDYFADSIAWLEKKHGKANIVCTTVHLDESTPHLCAYVVPIAKDGRLSAKEFVGGRKVLADLQTDFAEKVGKKHGLERGELMSNAVHREPAHIASMTKERRRLEKQVKALSDEIERLTKSVTGGADALKKTQAELAKEQSTMQRLMKFSMEDAGNIGRLTKENEEMKKALITATERDHQLVAEIKALRKENEHAQPTQEQLKAIDKVFAQERTLAQLQAALAASRSDLTEAKEVAQKAQQQVAQFAADLTKEKETMKIEIPDDVARELAYMVKLHQTHGAPNPMDSVNRLVNYVLASVADGSRRPGAWERSMLESLGLVAECGEHHQYRASYGGLVDDEAISDAQKAAERDSDAEVAWLAARGDLPPPVALASRLGLSQEAGSNSLIKTGRVVENYGLHAVLTFKGEKFLHKFDNKQDLELAIGRGGKGGIGGRA